MSANFSSLFGLGTSFLPDIGLAGYDPLLFSNPLQSTGFLGMDNTGFGLLGDGFNFTSPDLTSLFQPNFTDLSQQLALLQKLTGVKSALEDATDSAADSASTDSSTNLAKSDSDEDTIPAPVPVPEPAPVPASIPASQLVKPMMPTPRYGGLQPIPVSQDPMARFQPVIRGRIQAEANAAKAKAVETPAPQVQANVGADEETFTQYIKDELPKTKAFVLNRQANGAPDGDLDNMSSGTFSRLLNEFQYLDENKNDFLDAGEVMEAARTDASLIPIVERLNSDKFKGNKEFGLSKESLAELVKETDRLGREDNIANPEAAKQKYNILMIGMDKFLPTFDKVMDKYFEGYKFSRMPYSEVLKVMPLAYDYEGEAARKAKVPHLAKKDPRP